MSYEILWQWLVVGFAVCVYKYYGEVPLLKRLMLLRGIAAKEPDKSKAELVDSFRESQPALYWATASFWMLLAIAAWPVMAAGSVFGLFSALFLGEKE